MYPHCPELKIAFEYNGIQHYEISRGLIPYDDEEKLEERKYRDQRKEELCVKNNIKLCTIPYTYDFREPNKLEEFIRRWVSRISL
jgi:hypothetical protein